MRSPVALYRLLGDETRLRLLALVAEERLNVTELTHILGVAQSGVSRHLGLLRDAGLVAEDRAGGFTYFRAAPPPADGVLGHAWRLLEAQFADVAASRGGRGDRARLEEVRRLRKENFDAHGSEARQLVPGRSWAAWARALGHLLPPWRVADLGCGEGYLTVEVARWASRVIAIDRSAAVLDRARGLARRRRAANIVWKQGEIERVPLADGSVDLSLLSQALHHAAEPLDALGEAARITVPGGRVLVLDLREHDQGWVRERFGDRWLGFSDERLGRLLEQAGLADVRVSVGARMAGDPFTVLIASGRAPAGAGPRARAARPAGAGVRARAERPAGAGRRRPRELRP